MAFGKIFVVLLLCGCAELELFDPIGPDDCWIYVGDMEVEGWITESALEGTTYIRKGNCSDLDIQTAIETKE